MSRIWTALRGENVPSNRTQSGCRPNTTHASQSGTDCRFPLWMYAFRCDLIGWRIADFQSADHICVQDQALVILWFLLIIFCFISEFFKNILIFQNHWLLAVLKEDDDIAILKILVLL